MPYKAIYCLQDEVLQENNKTSQIENLCVSEHKMIFGKISMSSIRCPECHEFSLVVDGKSTCCNRNVGDTLVKRQIKVTSSPLPRRHLTPTQKLEILTKQNHKCFYCELPFYETWYMTDRMKFPRRLEPQFDHIVPKALTDNQELTNFVAACHLCNLVKFDRVFNDISKVIEFVKSKREKLNFTVVSE